MKIFSVINFGLNNYQNFKGITINKSSSSDSWDYHGEISGSSYDGHYIGSNDYVDDVYHPFADESEEEIKKALENGNYCTDYSTMGLGGGFTQSTERGKTLPYTKKEWEKLSEADQDKIRMLLKKS